jgi:phosphate/phosphite/phosphonate ABC transporter binding protein
MPSSLVVLGYATPEGRTKTRQRMTDFATRLSELSDHDVGIVPLASYRHVAQRLQRGEIDLAWLSPIPLVSLSANGMATALATLHRDQLVHYRCAIIVSSSATLSNLAALRGKRPAWVDQHSAAGYVLPRIELAAHGIGGDDLAGERFLGSHDAVVRAVASGHADFGATFARIARSGEVTGPWSRTPGLMRSIRVVTTFGAIPPDAIACRPDMDITVRTRVTEALHAMARSPKDRALVADALGADSLRAPEYAMYEAFRDLVFRAFRAGQLATFAEDAPVGADATLELRPPAEVPTLRRLPPPDRTDEADVIAVLDAAAAEDRLR